MTCPKCNGPMFRDRDRHGAYWYCLCGFYHDDIPEAEPVLLQERGRRWARWALTPARRSAGTSFSANVDRLACTLCGHRYHFRLCWAYEVGIPPLQQEPAECDCEGWGDQAWRKERVG